MYNNTIMLLFIQLASVAIISCVPGLTGLTNTNT